MKNYDRQNGFTLIEMMVVVAITIVLIGIVVGIASRIDTQNKEKLLHGTFALLNAALEEFADYGYQYKLQSGASADQIDFYRSLDYPVDCNDYPLTGVLSIQNEMAFVLNVPVGFYNANETSHSYEYSGIEVMYFFLNRVPASRAVLNKIKTDYLSNENISGQPMEFWIGTSNVRYPLMRINDPWGNVLRYDYYENLWIFRYSSTSTPRKQSIKNFPVLVSAGPDGEWNTGDEIKSR
ncbi:MAG: type II secretion system protein [Planctomycetota bacterium]|jgi:type II secretory pathway pseudopilin PulG